MVAGNEGMQENQRRPFKPSRQKMGQPSPSRQPRTLGRRVWLWNIFGIGINKACSECECLGKGKNQVVSGFHPDR